MKTQRKFAQGTRVASEKTRAEIEKLLRKRGIVSVGIMTSAEEATVLFERGDRKIKMSIALPGSDSPVPVDRNVGTEVRRRWRALLLVLKAKFAAVDDGIVTFEDEFLAQTVVKGVGGMTTVGELLRPSLELALRYDQGFKMLGDGR